MLILPDSAAGSPENAGEAAVMLSDEPNGVLACMTHTFVLSYQ